MKKINIKKHVNVHIITLVVTIFAVAILDVLKVYSISPVAMVIFVVGYSLFIIISTIIMISKSNNSDEKRKKK